MMTNVKLWFVCSTILILSSCVRDQRLNRPNIPLCIVLETGSCFCSFNEQDYEVNDCSSYLATDPESYSSMEKYVDSLELRLLNCLNNPKKCK
jgi:hypothetical protein